MILLSCKGIRVGNLMVPAFEVSTAEYVGLAIPTDYGSQWVDVISILGGVEKVQEVSIQARAVLVLPPGFDPCEDSVRKQTLIEYLRWRGLSHDLAEPLIDSLQLKCDQRLGELQLTPRTLLDLGCAWSRGAELVVFATAGLDPLGLRSVSRAVSERLNRCSAIHAYSDALKLDQDLLNVYSKVVRCAIDQT